MIDPCAPYWLSPLRPVARIVRHMRHPGLGRKVHRHLHHAAARPRLVVPACVKGGGLPLALGLPLLVGPALLPAFGGFGGFPAAPYAEYGMPAWGEGAAFWPGGFGPGGYGSQFPQAAFPPAAAVSAGLSPADVAVLPAPAASGGSPVTSPASPTQTASPETPTPVPEPASLRILLGMLALVFVGMLPARESAE